MQYRMIGIDLDGTLLNPKGAISAENAAAVAKARAGVLVVPCTGRAWRESRKPLAVLADVEAGVFVGGAAVSDLATGKSLDIAVIEPHLAMELVRFLFDLPEAVLVFRDANLVGHDYLITGKGSLTPNTEWWFQATGANVHFQRDLTLNDMHHTLRVGIVAGQTRMNEVTAGLRRTFPDRILLQHFQAVQMPDPDESVHVLEIFAKGVDKWRGLKWFADRDGIETNEIAVIGDEINDIAMLESAGCGIVMANATDEIKKHADHVTLSNEQHGVAHAIENLLTGKWG